MQRIDRIHLHSHRESEIEPGGSATVVYILAMIALLILSIASINFINLSTSRAVQRAREVGVRKVLGAHRSMLKAQFLGESVMMVMGAFAVALGLVHLALPAFNDFADASLTVPYSPAFFFLLLLLTLLVGAITGLYPAIVLSAFQPARALRGALTRGRRGVLLQKGMVVFQFTVSIALLIGTAVMYRQLDYVQQKELGFDEEQLIVLPLQGAAQERYEAFKAALEASPDVVRASATYSVPGRRMSQNTFWPEGVQEEADRPSMKTLYVDHDYLQTLGIEVVQGRGFSRAFARDSTQNFILNETAARILGWQEPIGKTFGWWERQGQIVGVVRDFHFESLHEEVEPLVLLIWPPMFRHVVLRVRPGGLTATMDHLEETWEAFVPERPFTYTFLDETVDRLYRADRRLRLIFGLFALLGGMISCLGLVGLAAHAAQRRTKEIGVRKVMGASVISILVLLSKDFASLVSVAFLIAAPVAYLAMNRWLEGFAYRIEMSGWIFLMAGLVALLMALFTVSYHATRAAMADPVKSLRYE